MFSFLRNFNVTGISKSKSDKNKNAFQVDLTDPNQIKTFFKTKKKFNTVIYLVGLAHSKWKNKDLDIFRKVNFLILKSFFKIM